MEENFNTDFNVQDQEASPSLDLGKIHFRCPSCSKLFSTKASNIQNEKPEYTCNSCSTDFWISFPEALSMSEVTGHPIIDKTKIQFQTSLIGESQNKKNKIGTEAKSKIEVKERDSAQETVQKNMEFRSEVSGQRGLIFNSEVHQENFKVESSQQEKKSFILDDLKSLIDEVENGDMEFISTSAPAQEEREPSVKDMWSNVLGDYSDVSLHDEFVTFCREEDDISYAVAKYQSMLDVNPLDKVAKSYLNKIKLSATIQAQNESAKKVEKIASNTSLGAFAAAAIGLGALFVVLGFSFVQLKNLVGLGIAIIFFTFAVQALLYKGE